MTNPVPVGAERKRLDWNRFVSLKMFNRILIGLATLWLMFTVFDFFQNQRTYDARWQNLEGRKPQVSAPEISRLEKVLPKDILAAVSARNLFSLTPLPAEKKLDAAPDPNQVVQNLRLVGILWGDVPQAMVENLQESRTVLVGQGDAIGDLRVKDILKNSVIVTNGAGNWEIK